MKRMRKKLLLGIFFMILGALHFWGNPASVAAPSGTLKMAIHPNLSADWLDPATVPSLTGSTNIPLNSIQDALVKAMPEGDLTPCLAESYTISPDYKVYEFKVRRGVKFHNGDTVTADDVLFSFWRNKSNYGKLIYDKVEKAEAVNPYLVRFRFKEPFPDFLEYFSSGESTILWVVPRKYLEKVGDAGFKRHPIGAGPYKFVEFVPGVRFVVEAFDAYWRKVPHIKRIEFHTVPDPATRLAMVRRGEADLATQITDVFYEDAKKDPRLKLLYPQSPAKTVLSMTTQWDPKSPWSDPRVRRAASLAIDRKTLADIFCPGTHPSGSIGLEGDPVAVQFSADPYDPEQAKKLLAEAGYPKGLQGGKFYPYDGPYRAYGEQIINYWKTVGISVDPIFLERPAWMATRNSGKFAGATFIDATGGSVTIARRLEYLLGGCRTCGNYPDIQASWEQYKREVSAPARKDLITRIQKMIYEKNMFIPLNQLGSPAVLSLRVKGNPYKVQPILWIPAPFEDIELEN